MGIQRGTCAILRTKSNDRSIAVDHNHRTTRVRGLLSKRANRDLLGAALESEWVLLAAAYYLICPPTSGEWIPPEDPDSPVAQLHELLMTFSPVRGFEIG